MPMLVIEGHYKIVRTSPDGDSVRFYPKDPKHWKLVEGSHRVRTNRSGGAQLRLDGIDALETHYPVRHGPVVHQPQEFAEGAAKELLKWLGFKNVKRNGETVTSAQPAQGVAGYILTRGADKYGRCVALVGKGKAPGTSGSNIVVDAAILKKTANYHQLTMGLAYPTYYTNLYVELRDEMTDAVTTAFSSNSGLWPQDVTESGAKINSLQDLTDHLVIMPKLFRRLVDYIVLNDGSTDLGGFKDFLDARKDRLIILSEGKVTGFSTVIDTPNRNTVRLNHSPEDLVFQEA
ncbi:nuclease [Streptomyces gilvosporeus]|uniref:Nuclease n=1 Tax=Streptomyces gilvosporeus TaxID=553510 RepID=A0A1V0TYR9_9ACTN|nr:nuclease [Streptomyces gilvosporeus]ARF58086.1 nuclease [Streptomyces gilvosporeus]